LIKHLIDEAKNIEVYDIDIPKPHLDQLVSYTEKLENEKRLQISGPCYYHGKLLE
jgi:hypothetical protein